MLKTVDGAVRDTGRKHIAVGGFTLSSAEQTCQEYKPGWVLVEGGIATISYFLCRSEKITPFLCDFPGYF